MEVIFHDSVRYSMSIKGIFKIDNIQVSREEIDIIRRYRTLLNIEKEFLRNMLGIEEDTEDGEVDDN